MGAKDNVRVEESVEIITNRKYRYEVLLEKDDFTNMFQLQERDVARWELNYNEPEFRDGRPLSEDLLVLKAFDKENSPIYLIKTGYTDNHFAYNLTAIAAEYLIGEGLDVTSNIKIVYDKEKISQGVIPVSWVHEKVERTSVEPTTSAV